MGLPLHAYENGKKVCVLEQHYTAGSFTRSYERNGYEWDVGYYIGDMGHTKTTARRIFDYITNGNLKWSAMDKGFDRIFIGKETNLNSGKAAYRQGLIAPSPKKKLPLMSTLNACTALKGLCKLATLQKILPSWLNRIIDVLIKHKRPVWFEQTTREVLKTSLIKC